MSEAQARQRLDKWLWAARFFKTRSLAAAAVQGGKVRLDGQHAKPAKEIKTGDTLEITLGDQQWTVLVLAINAQRRPAVEARLLYAETPQSLARRELVLAQKALAPAPGSDLRGRPSKKAGRQIRRFSESG